MKSGGILVVEDEMIVAMGIKLKLEEMGYTVCGIVADGQTAINMASHLKPDLILMDIVLKGNIDGIEAAKVIKQKLAPHFIFLTGISDKAILQRVHELKPVGTIMKPFDDSHLRNMIEAALSENQSSSEALDFSDSCVLSG
ncbi:response regulator receiver domain-containing protein [Methanohalophilus euhalobius]|jgi:CheY-like chemotaxis protein|uniref:Response regulator receiver domain-containing protein n=1 Tax=Methanohalophilus euhalobius TaxID=51203 RepID=A0A285ENI7_9EURY|nr:MULTISPECIES: response regulator [Methanohalophilus]ODV49153.1 MAG: response regulator receiver protein [Methanohalophilus sp. 2-GBenrich]RXG33856.1 response regulator receiver protein [Methanohalophilus sp. WG1-DM]TCL10986.1 response regulator receiver domain-containing protein [Methanohalophilus euhalobius]SNX99541.1 Response regulator receiver domain-containing protein [Methanohalophilus euhalobius]